MRQDIVELARYSGDPWHPGNEYFTQAEAHMARSWREDILPMIGGCDFTSVIDLAAGHGRNTAMLLPRAGHVLALDIQLANVERMWRRFGDDPRLSYAVNNGYDLDVAVDGGYTLVYCFDAMVHFHREVVRSYLADTFRVLEPGGHGFFHHSNYTGQDDWRTAPASRAYLDHRVFAAYARGAGLDVVDQRVLDWDGHPALDCLTLVRKPDTPGTEPAHLAG
jgi:SAM-dependent methyltransferase